MNGSDSGDDSPGKLHPNRRSLAHHDAASFSRGSEVSGAISEGSGLYQLLVESVLEYAIFALDPDGVILSWNSGAQRIKGYTANEIIGKHFSVFYA